MRRRMMMQSGGEYDYSLDYKNTAANDNYHIEKYSTYGDFFKVFNELKKHNDTYFKDITHVIVLTKTTTSYKTSSTSGHGCLLFYEEGVGLKYYGNGKTFTHTFVSVDSCKCICLFPSRYSSNKSSFGTGNDNKNENILIDCGTNENYVNYGFNILYYKKTANLLNVNTSATLISGNTSVIYFPLVNKMGTTKSTTYYNNATKIVLGRWITIINLYSLSTTLSNLPNLTDVWWPIEDVSKITIGSSGIRVSASKVKLHVPKGMRDAVIAKGYTTTAFKGGVFDDLEDTLPEYIR